MSETETSQAEAKTAKKETVYEAVKMEDGSTVEFAGTRQVSKTILEDATGVATGVRFDFRNGATRTLSLAELSPALLAQCAAHGVSQKAGDEYSGVKEIDDIVLAVDEIFARLRSGEWGVARGAGDSTAGASVVIKAIMEATGKDQTTVKGFLQGKLDTAKARGEKLSRAELYASFRNPTTKTGAIIARLEADKKVKAEKELSAEDMAYGGYKGAYKEFTDAIKRVTDNAEAAAHLRATLLPVVSAEIADTLDSEPQA